MEERIEQLRNSAHTAGVYAKRVAESFDVSIEHDGNGFIISGDTKDVLMAKDAFMALDKLSNDSVLDIFSLNHDLLIENLPRTN